MKQIKTISKFLDDAKTFDQEVNQAINDGWTLKRRDVIVPHGDQRASSLYAELECDTDQTKRCCEACGMERCTDAPCRAHDANLKQAPKFIDCTTCKYNEDRTNAHCRKCETHSEWEELEK